MLNQPEASVVLSEKEQVAIDTAKTILLNVEAEITTHNKVLKTLKGDIVKAKEEHEYIESNVDKLRLQETQLTESVSSLERSRAEVIQDTEVRARENNERSEELYAKELELDAREVAISAMELDTVRERAELDEQKQVVSAEKTAVEVAKKAFTEAGLTVTWS